MLYVAYVACCSQMYKPKQVEDFDEFEETCSTFCWVFLQKTNEEYPANHRICLELTMTVVIELRMHDFITALRPQWIISCCVVHHHALECYTQTPHSARIFLNFHWISVQTRIGLVCFLWPCTKFATGLFFASLQRDAIIAGCLRVTLHISPWQALVGKGNYCLQPPLIFW